MLNASGICAGTSEQNDCKKGKLRVSPDLRPGPKSMTPEERFEQIEATLQSVSNRLDILTKIHLDSDREWRERMDRSQQEWRERMERDGQEWRERVERMERDGREWRERMGRIEAAIAQDAEHIRALAVNTVQAADAIARLARIAERHEERLDDLEGTA